VGPRAEVTFLKSLGGEGFRISRMWELRRNLGAYDAPYIALAEALGCELLTGDAKLKNAAGHHATVIVSR
jgi:predicted nucleic acid-binding protein